MLLARGPTFGRAHADPSAASRGARADPSAASPGAGYSGESTAPEASLPFGQ
jgi:hypothetical protein